MIVRKPDRSFCRSTWPPGTWFPPSMHGCMYFVTARNLVRKSQRLVLSQATLLITSKEPSYEFR